MKNIILALLMLSSSLLATPSVESETMFSGSGSSPGASLDRARLSLSYAKQDARFVSSDTHQVGTNCYVTLIKAKYISNVHNY